MCPTQPSVVLPTVLALPQARSRPGPLDDLDYSIGNKALAAATACSLQYPVRQGVVSALKTRAGQALIKCTRLVT